MTRPGTAAVPGGEKPADVAADRALRDALALHRRAAEERGREPRVRHRGIAAACAGLRALRDRSMSTTARPTRPPPRCSALEARFPMLRLVRHATSAGQSAAIHSGVTLARGEVICTLDGDGQNPPSEIPKLVARLDGRRFPDGRRAGRRPAGRAPGHRLEAAGLAGGQLDPRAPAQGRHARHRLRAEADPPRRLPRPALFRPHAPLPAGAGRPRRLDDAARRRRARARATPAARTTPTSGGRWSASTTSSA